MKSKNKILIAQGGGPTMVINKSLASIIQEAKKKEFAIYGAINGVNGIINNQIKNISYLSNTKFGFIIARLF